MKNKSPLAIHILLHPKFKNKERYQNKIYSTFNRDVKEYLNRGLNIPVYFYDNASNKINYEKYEQNLVVILIDDEMVCDDMFVVTDIVSNPKLTIVPVALSRNSSKKDKFFDQYNYIQAYKENNTLEDEIEYVLFELAHAVSTLLFHKKNLKIFLSHAKKDGAKIAIKFKNYLGEETKLDDFFDTNSIKNSDDWRQSLKDGVEESILLAFQTDQYSTREWCRREILMAKEAGIPIVVVNRLKSIEKRAFPYMANVPTVTLSKKNDFQKVIFYLLLESIRMSYQKRFINYFMGLFFEDTEYNLLSSAPELLSLVQGQNRATTFIYPDPPLGNEELRLLKQFNAKFSFDTPLSYMTSQIDLSSLNIAISVSESENIEECGVRDIHLRDFIIELSRYLLATQATLLYGGDINYSEPLNFAQIIADLTQTYQQDYKKKVSVKNYLAYPFYEKLDRGLEADLKGVVEFVNVKKDSDTSPLLTEPIKRVMSLTKMRSMMTQELNIRIIAGAKTKGFMGRYSGVLEEAYMALSKNRPVFLVGAFCGVAKELIDALKGENPKAFTVKYHLGTEPFSSSFKNEIEEIDKEYNTMVKKLNSWGVERLNNGLSIEENEILFSSQNIYEIIYLILKGIGIVKKKLKKDKNET